ncbi:MAG TPA: SDR family NAD(P)-dependent oxidoreductase [Acidisoma sp.]|jgi:NAD(P)-dependent dehydrogenase (short-subunit alcohol dehydrogenase family)|nr:SDR family NAD(P)-dependent oxidoreductase [Acidisoma sp.]
MPELDQRVAVVTGAAMGIGKASALALAAAGASVAVLDVEEEVGRGSVAEIEAAGGVARFFRVDVRSMAEIHSAVDEILDAWQRIDILVNNAARGFGGVVDEIDEADWDEVISTNLSSVWRCMRCVVPQMRRQASGSVVNMSSVQALRGFRGWAGYAAAKGGINGLTQQAAVDLAPAGIRVNAIAPGTIMTPLNEKVFQAAANPQELIDRWNSAHPLGRFGQAQEVAEAVLFLASDRSSFITGEILRVDGGLAVKGD